MKCLIVFLLLVHSAQSLLPITKLLSSSRSSGTNHNKLHKATSGASVQDWKPDWDYKTSNKLPWLEGGYKYWNFNGFKINYLSVGGNELFEGKQKQPILLIHGFGASVYHWRYNIPYLARRYHVYAIDLLGFGLSDKPILDYSAELWRDQVLAFIKEIIYVETKKPVVTIGNSLGGFTALYAASKSNNNKDNLVNGCVLVNSAGRFKDPGAENEAANDDKNEGFFDKIKAAFQRFIISLSFIYTKQPARIEQVLRQVYPINPGNVDPELVRSIQYPSFHPNAAEVFYRVIAKNGNGPPALINDLLDNFKLPLMLLWGVNDPWIRPKAADMIQEIYPSATRVNLDAGHCPHDESPDDCNRAIENFLETLQA